MQDLKSQSEQSSKTISDHYHEKKARRNVDKVNVDLSYIDHHRNRYWFKLANNDGKNINFVKIHKRELLTKDSIIPLDIIEQLQTSICHSTDFPLNQRSGRFTLHVDELSPTFECNGVQSVDYSASEKIFGERHASKARHPNTKRPGEELNTLDSELPRNHKRDLQLANALTTSPTDHLTGQFKRPTNHSPKYPTYPVEIPVNDGTVTIEFTIKNTTSYDAEISDFEKLVESQAQSDPKNLPGTEIAVAPCNRILDENQIAHSESGVSGEWGIATIHDHTLNKHGKSTHFQIHQLPPVNMDGERTV